MLFVPSKCAFSTLQALVQSPSIPDLRRKNKAEFAASQLSSTKSLFQFFSGCCFALPASRDSDLVQPMQSRTSSTKKGRSISSKSQVASQLQQQVPRRPVVPSPRPVAALPAPKWNARHPERPASWRFAERPAQNARACGFPGRCRAFCPGVRRAFCLAFAWRPVAVADLTRLRTNENMDVIKKQIAPIKKQLDRLESIFSLLVAVNPMGF